MFYPKYQKHKVLVVIIVDMEAVLLSWDESLGRYINSDLSKNTFWNKFETNSKIELIVQNY